MELSREEILKMSSEEKKLKNYLESKIEKHGFPYVMNYLHHWLSANNDKSVQNAINSIIKGR